MWISILKVNAKPQLLIPDWSPSFNSCSNLRCLFFFENVFECTSRILYKKIIISKDEYFSHKRMLKFSGPINVIVFEKRLINL